MINQIFTKSIQQKDDEYFKNGLIYCKKCDTPRSVIFENKLYRCSCYCENEDFKKQEQEREQDELKAQIDNLKLNSLLGKRYFNVSFENTKIANDNFKNAFELCKKYCQNYDVVLETGLGLYIHGPSGTGKTHLMACMVNNLIKSGQSTMITNFSEIGKQIRATFNGFGNELNFINKLSEIDFLFIDDFGTEIVQRNGEDSFMQERIYDIINARYNNLKPTSFTSNYSFAELIQGRGIMQKTIDRINEMSRHIIKLNCDNFRILKINGR